MSAIYCEEQNTMREIIIIIKKTVGGGLQSLISQVEMLRATSLNVKGLKCSNAVGVKRLEDFFNERVNW